MTQAEILNEFKQLSFREQLEMLRAALEIIEGNFEASSQQPVEGASIFDPATSEDPLLSLAGQFAFSSADISEQHDKYIGLNIKDADDE